MDQHTNQFILLEKSPSEELFNAESRRWGINWQCMWLLSHKLIVEIIEDCKNAESAVIRIEYSFENMFPHYSNFLKLKKWLMKLSFFNCTLFRCQNLRFRQTFLTCFHARSNGSNEIRQQLKYNQEFLEILIRCLTLIGITIRQAECDQMHTITISDFFRLVIMIRSSLS